jgi:predicted Fe-Mo cluster-binding NifX family protein
MSFLVVSSQGPGTDSRVEPRLERAAHLLAVDPEAAGARDLGPAGGPQEIADTLSSAGARAVACRSVAQETRDALQKAGVRVLEAGPERVDQVAEAFLRGELPALAPEGSAESGMESGLGTL